MQLPAWSPAPLPCGTSFELHRGGQREVSMGGELSLQAVGRSPSPVSPRGVERNASGHCSHRSSVQTLTCLLVCYRGDGLHSVHPEAGPHELFKSIVGEECGGAVQVWVYRQGQRRCSKEYSPVVWQGRTVGRNVCGALDIGPADAACPVCVKHRKRIPWEQETVSQGRPEPIALWAGNVKRLHHPP